MSPIDTRTFNTFGPVTDFWVGLHNTFTFRGLKINDRSLLETYWITDVTGFDSPDLLVSAQPSAEENRELPDPGFYGGRTMTFTGYICAGTYPQIIRMARALENAMLGLAETTLLISTDPTSAIFKMPDQNIACRPVDKLAIDTKVSDGRHGMFRQQFSFSLRASNPAYLSPVVHNQTLLPTVVNQLGRVYDKTFDVVYSHLLDNQFNPVTGSGANTMTVHNDGNWLAFPLITITGAVTQLVLTNQTTNQKVTLTSALGTAQQIIINTLTGNITDALGNFVSSLVDDSSDWIVLQGKNAQQGTTGDNLIVVSVGSYDGSASIRFDWQDTSI